MYSCAITDTGILKVIGAGGFGTVYEMTDGTVVKAIVSKKGCEEASIEFTKQQKIYNAFERLKLIESSNPVVRLVQRYVKVSKPLESCDSSFSLRERSYSCYIRMTKLPSVPIEMLYQLDRDISTQIDMPPERVPDLMIHASLNTEVPERIYGVQYVAKKLTEKNPPRGYFTNINGVVIEKLRSQFGFPLTGIQLKQLMGFIYGYIYFFVGIVPIDIELTLGYDQETKQFALNVLDFGMTIDTADLDSTPVLPRNVGILEMLRNNEDITEETVENVSYDIYCDLEDDQECRAGWKLVRDLHAAATSK